MGKTKHQRYIAIIIIVVSLMGFTRIYGQSLAVFEEADGLVAVEAEHNSAQKSCENTSQLKGFVAGLEETSGRPWIWADKADKDVILSNIANYTWAASLKNNLKSRVDATKNAHKSNPASYINSIATVPGSRSSHCNVLDKAVEAGILYFLYDDEDYAQLAADIIHHYAVRLGVDDYTKCDFISGEDFFLESRIVFTRYAIAYDFIYDFVHKPATTVYDKTTGTRRPFDHEKAQQTCKNFADLVFKNGGLKSNHSILEGGGALYNIMCISDSLTRESYFNRFWNGDTKHDAFYGYTLKSFSVQGLWPESMSYGKGPHAGVMKYMETIDRFKPELHVVENNLNVLHGAFLYEDFKYPNNIEMAAYGDSRRNSTGTEELYRYVLKIATRKNLTELADRAYSILRQTYKLNGYSPKIETQYLDWDEPLKLLWGFHFDLSGSVPPIKYHTTADVTHAGVVMQRNYHCDDTKTNGLVYYTGGAHYVHSHLSGLDMELYGAGYVMGGVAADMPSSNDRDMDINRHYYRIYAGHNTVIVNGTSQGRGQGSWKSDGILWQNNTVLQSAEPKPLEEPLDENFCFSTQFLDDNVNNCDQQRTNAIVRTSSTTGYYLDLFRSKSNLTNHFHDYIYHNIGDEMTLSDSTGNALPLSAASTRYQSFDVTYNGAVVKFPGWHYFENVNTSDETTKMVKSRIKLNTSPNRFIHVTLPGGMGREYTKALAPPILEAAAGYNKKKAQVLTIRQNGEAWDRPFIAVFEPSTHAVATVQSAELMMNGSEVVGVKVVSHVENRIINDYIFSHDNASGVFSSESLGLSFEGRFGIVRTEVKDGKTRVDMYIGDGERLSYIGNELSGGETKRAYTTFEIDSVYNAIQRTGQEPVISLFPNPARGFVTIQTSTPKECTYQIYSMSGILIDQGTFYKERTIQMKIRNEGMYLVKIEWAGGVRFEKIILKNG